MLILPTRTRADRARALGAGQRWAAQIAHECEARRWGLPKPRTNASSAPGSSNESVSWHLAVKTCARCAAQQMAAAEEKRLNELEAQQSLLAKQLDVLQQHLGVPAADAEEVDQPLAEYARNFVVVILLCVFVTVGMVVAALFSPLGLYSNSSQAICYLWPICWTALFGLIFGTLDSSEAGRRGIELLRVFACCQVVTEFLMFWSVKRYEEAVFQIFAQGINALCYPWLCKLILQMLRPRGNLSAQAEHYSNRLLKVAGLQILIAVGAAAMGIDGRRTSDRFFAAVTFSISLYVGWFYLVAIFDACNVESRAAAKLRLTCLQTAALISTGLQILAGLAGYILAGQKSPSSRATFAVLYAMVLTYYLALGFVFRLVWKARYGPGAASAAAAASVKPVDALGALDLP